MDKIGVFVPVNYRGGTLNAAKNIAKMLHLGSRANNEPVNVIFSCIADFYEIEVEFSDLLELGIRVRETTWKTFSNEEVQSVLNLQNAKSVLNHPTYMYPADGICNFNDCDFWLIISDRTSYPLAPVKPYGAMIYDYIQRYVPELFTTFEEAAFLATARNAKFVMVTTPSTHADAIQYAGVAKDRVHLIPMEFNPFYITPQPTSIMQDYFLWTTNLAYHKNHFRALDALEIYYTELEGKLSVVITGIDTDQCNVNLPEHKDISPNIKKVRSIIEKKPVLKKNLTFVGNTGTNDFISILASAKFLWHPTSFDNGTYSVIEAGFYGIPSLSSDYPAMRFIDERFKLNLNFCDPSSAKNLAKKLKEMEEEYQKRRDSLPNKEFLEQFSYKKLAPNFWQIFRDLI